MNYYLKTESFVLPINHNAAMCLNHPTRTSHSCNMFSLLTVCFCVIFTLGIEAAPEPKPCRPPWCIYGEGGLGGWGTPTFWPTFYNRVHYPHHANIPPCQQGA